jgi:hypothetical protein
MRAIVVFATVVTLLANSAFGQDQVKAKVRVAGLKVVKLLTREDADLIFANRSGTEVTLLIDLPDKKIVDVDAWEFTTKGSFTDDLGTNLTKPPKTRPAKALENELTPSPIMVWDRISKDLHRACLTIDAVGVPAKGAKTIHLKGAIVFNCALSEKTVEVKNITLDKKLKQMVDQFALSYVQLGFEDEPEPGLQVTWKGVRGIRSIAVINSDGKTAELRTAGGFYIGRGEEKEQTDRYATIGVKGPCTLRITYYDKMEAVKVPLDLKVGMGL